MRRPFLTGLATLAAVLLLDALLVVGDWIEDRHALIPRQVAVELVALLALLGLGVWLRGGRPLPRLAAWALGALLLVVGMLRAADIMVPWYFGRYFNAAVDLKFLPVFYNIVREAVPPVQFSLILAGLALGLVAGVAVLRYAVAALWHGLASRRPEPFAAAGVGLACLWLAVPPTTGGEDLLTAKTAQVVGHNLRVLLDADGVRREHQAQIEQAVAARPPVTNLRKLAGHNVLLVFIESYGAINFKDPSFASVQMDTVKAFEQRVKAAGYHVYSDSLISPITGGGSWMAHATLTTGIRIDNQDFYEQVLTGSFDALGGLFRNDGWRTVAAMPRIQQPWPEGAFFGFEKFYYDANFGYDGRRFSWESIPDQFVLEKMHRFELTGPKQPVFIQYVLASSHTPFDLIPTQVADPTRLTDGTNYFQQEALPFPVRDGRVFENVAGYQAAIRYSLDSIGRYLAERLKDDSLIIVLGDHQPPLTVAAASRDKMVPIHVLSRDPAVLAPFVQAGWSAGMTPSFQSTNTMESFFASFVSGFSVADAAPRR